MRVKFLLRKCRRIFPTAVHLPKQMFWQLWAHCSGRWPKTWWRGKLCVLVHSVLFSWRWTAEALKKSPTLRKVKSREYVSVSDREHAFRKIFATWNTHLQQSNRHKYVKREDRKFSKKAAGNPTSATISTPDESIAHFRGGDFFVPIKGKKHLNIRKNYLTFFEKRPVFFWKLQVFSKKLLEVSEKVPEKNAKCTKTRNIELLMLSNSTKIEFQNIISV